MVVVLIGVLINSNSKINGYEQVLNVSIGQENNMDTTEISSTNIRDWSHDYTLVDSVEWDIDRDDVEESIELYVSAARGEDGEWAFDCGQKWLVLVKRDTKEYVIFEDHIQHGEMEVRVYEIYGSEGDISFHISTVLDSTASLVIDEFTYIKSNDTFIKDKILDRDNVNYINTIEI